LKNCKNLKHLGLRPLTPYFGLGSQNFVFVFHYDHKILCVPACHEYSTGTNILFIHSHQSKKKFCLSIIFSCPSSPPPPQTKKLTVKLLSLIFFLHYFLITTHLTCGSVNFQSSQDHGYFCPKNISLFTAKFQNQVAATGKPS